MGYGNFAFDRQNAAMAQEQFLAWLIEQLRQQGHGAKSRLADHLRIEPSAVSRLLKGERSISLEEAQRIFEFFGKYLNAHEADFLKETINLEGGEPTKERKLFAEVLNPPDLPPQPKRLSITGEVAAGLWLEANLFEQETTANTPILGDGRYPADQQFLVRVRGDSMNKIVQNGELALCLDWAQNGHEIKSGDIVIVERSRDGGLTIERTLKQVVMTETGVELWPRSTDPRFQEPIVYDDHDEETEVRIIAKYLWAVRLIE